MTRKTTATIEYTVLIENYKPDPNNSCECNGLAVIGEDVLTRKTYHGMFKKGSPGYLKTEERIKNKIRDQGLQRNNLDTGTKIICTSMGKPGPDNKIEILVKK